MAPEGPEKTGFPGITFFVRVLLDCELNSNVIIRVRTRALSEPGEGDEKEQTLVDHWLVS